MGKAVIAGSGPVGALTAIYLAQQGYSVDVFEKRKCPDTIPPAHDSKAYLLNLNFRAFAAFKEAGVSVEALLKRCNGRSEFTFRDANGRINAAVNMPVTPEDPTMIRVYRDEISRHLIDEARRLHPDAITFHFEAGVAGVDLDKRVAHISGQTPQEMQYDLLVGADGAGSVVRSELQKAMPPGFLKRKTHTAVYATGPLKIEDPREYPRHTFTTMDSFAYGAVMVYGRGNGDYRLGLFLDKGGSQRLKQGDDKWLQDALDTSMPHLLSDARASAKTLAANPPDFSSVSSWTYLSQFHGPRVVLLGDAAHTMTPILGQGCNSGLEDAYIFAGTLRKHKDPDAALPAYTEARLPDIQALIQLNEVVAAGRFRHVIAEGEGNTALLHSLWLRTQSAVLATQMARMALHRKAPSLFSMPPMYQAMTGVTPFRKIMPAAYFDVASIFVVGALAVGGLRYALRRS